MKNIVFFVFTVFYNKNNVFISFSLSVRPSRVVRRAGPSVPGGPDGRTLPFPRKTSQKLTKTYKKTKEKQVSA